MDKDSYLKLQVQLGKIVKHQRNIVKNYSQEKLAELTNISVITISRLEQGKQLASLPTFIKLFDTLSMDANQYIPLLRELIDEDEADDI